MSAKAYLYLVVTTFLWGGNTAFGKMAVGHVSPMMLNLSRWGIAFMLITAISVPQLRRDWPEIRRNWLLLLAYGAIGYTAFNGFLYSALKYTSAVNGAIEQGGIPVLIFIINFIFFRIPVSAIQILGFLISFVGVALTASHGDLATLLTLTLNYGDALLLLAVLAYSLYTVALRWRPQIHWRSLMAGSAFGATLAALPLVFWEAETGNLILPDTLGLAIIAYAALLPSLVSQILYVKGVEVIGANRAGLFVNLVPVFGTLLSILVVGESLQLFHVVAMVLVLGGIAIAEWGKPKEKT
ncbi:DMT family transporter [Ciceribacter sp. L1K23]|uniref:DMT family transporter n=1 Tax=unclassified Ciceribacter TaxID=2628820 RepID=UPI001ABDED52|nr:MULTISPECIES: DMT family transporter [unclassified Ciceribacter]MBO3761966.1 DMT family transporter [Ciceribacter sp. L1K22]MBR0554757.1 DMT family transporter [Ciceribacter sp. L1K23]